MDAAIRLTVSSAPSSAAIAFPTNSAAGSPLRSALAASSIASFATAVRFGAGPTVAGVAGSSHDTSAATISVAMQPGGASEAVIASAASCPTVSGPDGRRIQPETFAARLSMSDESGASSGWWYVACSPTMFTIGVCARRALWRFAMPLPRPGPRCSNVAAGLPVMRAYPSAAPVTTPSNRPSTARISGAVSSAATKCISEVPGLVKHTSTPPSTSVRMSACAPFM